MRDVRNLASKPFKRLVFDAGPFILLFTNEEGSDIAREAVLLHERGEIEIFMHPNNLVESYAVLSRISKENPKLLARKVEPSTVIRSAYATLNVVYDEKTALKLGALKLRYEDKPWGDLSSAALALRLSDGEKVPIIILDEEKHFEDIKEVASVKVSDLRDYMTVKKEKS
jgi:predicted nucleic acid-binding protein